MNMQRIAELRTALEDENISYAELAEIESAFIELPDEVLRDSRENATAGDMLDELAENFHVRTYDALASALSPLGLEWTVEGLMTRLHDVEAFSQNS